MGRATMERTELEDDPYRPFAEIIAGHARRHPDKEAIFSIAEGRGLTYRDLWRSTNRVAAALRARGIGAGDRVMLLATNSLAMVTAYLGILRHGATVCTVNVETNAFHLTEIANAVSPRLALFENDRDIAGPAGQTSNESMLLDQFLDSLPVDAAENDAPSVCHPEDHAVIFYTSGTEAQPKGVIYSHATLYYNFDSVADMIGLRADDRVLDFRALSWISAQQLGLGAPLLRGATAVIAERFSRGQYLEWIRDHDIDIAACVPAGVAMLLNEPVALRADDLPRLRFITSSSAPLLVEQWRAFENYYGIAIAQGYGMSEAGWITGSHRDNRRHGTVGRPVKHQRVRILDEAGRNLPPGETGEIEASGGRQQSHGYLLSDGTIRRTPEGGVRTGDLGYLDDDGYLHVTGRAKDLIIRGGVNIAPLEIDGVISELAEIAEACTVGVPDPIYGEEVVSYVALKTGAHLTGDEIQAHCATRLPDLKTPKKVVIRDSLPRTARGKLDRNALADEWRNANGT